MFFSKVKPGGVLCGHDCEDFEGVEEFSNEEIMFEMSGGRHKGVIAAVYTHFGEVEIISGGQDTLWIKRRW